MSEPLIGSGLSRAATLLSIPHLKGIPSNVVFHCLLLSTNFPIVFFEIVPSCGGYGTIDFGQNNQEIDKDGELTNGSLYARSKEQDHPGATL